MRTARSSRTMSSRLIGGLLVIGVALTGAGLTACTGDGGRVGDDGKIGGVQVQENYPDITLNLTGGHGDFQQRKNAEGKRPPQKIVFKADENLKLGYFDLVIIAPADAAGTRFELDGHPGELVIQDKGDKTAGGTHIYPHVRPGTYELLAGDNGKDAAKQLGDMRHTGIKIEVVLP